MEEQRQRQEDEARRAAVTSAAEAGISSPGADGERHFCYRCSFAYFSRSVFLISLHFIYVMLQSLRILF